MDNSTSLSKESIYGNIWVREIAFLKAGDFKEGHKHRFDHLHFLAQGSVKIITMIDNDTKEEEEQTYIAPAWIKVPKEVSHTIIALEDMSFGYCMEALRDEDGEIMETDFKADLETEKCSAIQKVVI